MQGLGRQAGRVALVADHDDAQGVARGLGEAVAALGVEAPFQFIALDDVGAGDETVPFAQGGVTDVDQERVAGLGSLVGLPRFDPLVARPDAFQQLVDSGRGLRGVARRLRCGAHCQSSGRSTCSSRRTGPLRL